jgi:dolichol-phosphate mannosyltransferase
VNSVVVIPTYDEAESITTVLDGVIASVGSDVLVVDSSSPDGTADIVRAHPEFGGRVHLLSRPGKGGLGAAYRAAFAWAIDEGYAVIAQMDADMSHSPEVVGDLLARCRGGCQGGTADVVIGSRYVRGGGTVNWPWHRQLISRGGDVYVGLVLGVPVRDATAGFRAYAAGSLQALGVLDSTSNGYCFQIENTWRACRAGMRVEEVPITFTERASGKSKMSKQIVGEAVVLVLFWRLAELLAKARHLLHQLRRGGRRSH